VAARADFRLLLAVIPLQESIGGLQVQFAVFGVLRKPTSGGPLVHPKPPHRARYLLGRPRVIPVVEDDIDTGTCPVGPVDVDDEIEFCVAKLSLDHFKSFTERGVQFSGSVGIKRINSPHDKPCHKVEAEVGQQ